ncbi:MAG: hypothetical protein IJ557_05700 [Bacteroidaceae bacterium]|nr:hypothetical protein [Bacteroidaceae bacterium]
MELHNRWTANILATLSATALKRTANILTTCLALALIVLLSSCQESKRERFEREAREWTKKNCPRPEFEDIIILDSLVCHNDGNNDYVYCYSVKADSIMLEQMEQMHEQLKESLLMAVRNSVDLRHVKEEGLNIVYAYYNAETREKVSEFRFTTEDYR